MAASPSVYSCAKVFQPNMETLARQRDSQPGDVRYLTNDPRGYFEEVQNRFAAQKAKDPNRPYGFPMPELRKTVLDLREMVAERLIQYGLGQNVIWRKSDERWIKFYSAIGMKSAVLRIYDNARIERDLLRAIQKDLEAIDENAPAYDEMIRLGYYTSRAMSLTNEFYRPYRMLLLNHFLQTKLKTPRQELADYRSNQDLFVGVRKPSTYMSIFTDASEIFDPNQLRMVILPTVGALDSQIFVRLQGVPLYPAGVLASDLSADGWIFNSAELYSHDILFHGGLLTRATNNFYKKLKLTPEEIQRFQDKQDEWFERFITAVDSLTDPKLKAGIMDLTITTIHDRANIFYPGSFIEAGEKRWGHINTFTIGRLYWAAAGQLGNTGLSTNLRQNLRETDEALTWMVGFWSQPVFTADPVYLAIEERARQVR